MLADNWMLVMGVPVIGVLVFMAVQRVRRLRRRIEEVREEMARNPLPPFAQLSELIQDQKTQERTRGKRTH